MIEGCKHGPTFAIPQPCADCERERREEAERLKPIMERLSELKAQAIAPATAQLATDDEGMKGAISDLAWQILHDMSEGDGEHTERLDHGLIVAKISNFLKQVAPAAALSPTPAADFGLAPEMQPVVDELRRRMAGSQLPDKTEPEFDRLTAQKDAIQAKRAESADLTPTLSALLADELDTLCQAIEGHRGGALTNAGLWHYHEKARAVLKSAALSPTQFENRSPNGAGHAVKGSSCRETAASAETAMDGAGSIPADSQSLSPSEEPDDSMTWERAALIFGEQLAPVGPVGYYQFTPRQWLTWAREASAPLSPDAQENTHEEENQQARGGQATTGEAMGGDDAPPRCGDGSDAEPIRPGTAQRPQAKEVTGLSPAPAPLKDSKLVRRIVNAVIQANTAVLADQYVAEILSEVSALSPQPPTSELEAAARQVLKDVPDFSESRQKFRLSATPLNEPLPCPLCGGPAYATRTVNGTQMFNVGCPSCGIELKAAWYRDQDKPTKDILSLWNTRGGSPQPPSEARK